VSGIVGAVTPLSWSPGGAGAAALDVRLPDGTPVAPAPTVTGAAGVYTADLATTQAGRHLLTWSRAGELFADVLDVWPVDPRYLISIDDALDACRFAKPAARDAARDQMPLYVAAATPVIEDMTGPLITTERTKLADGGTSAILLPAAPAQVVSVTVSGVLLPAASYVVDEAAGIVYAAESVYAYLAAGYGYGLFTPGRLNVVIVYTVGSPVLAPNLRLAVREEVAYLWSMGQQQPRQGTSGAPDATVFTPSGFAVPRRVSELCAAHPRVAGFA
jgi:hypothetical protein